MGCGGGNSISSIYGGASVIGPSQRPNTNNVDLKTVVTLVPVPTDGVSPFVPAVFVIVFLSANSDIVMRQGGVNLVIADVTASDFRIDSTKAQSVFWRVDVNNPDQSKLAIFTPDGALVTGDIVITRIDSVNAVGTP